MASTDVCLWCPHPRTAHTPNPAVVDFVAGRCLATECSCAIFTAPREPLSTAVLSTLAPCSTEVVEVMPPKVEKQRSPKRERLPEQRQSLTRVFRLSRLHKDGSRDTLKLYLTVGMYDDGRPGELFIRADKIGTLASGALDATAIFASLLLQHGVPIEEVVSKLRYTRYPPDGITGDQEFPFCTSPLDLVAQWLTKRFVK